MKKYGFSFQGSKSKVAEKIMAKSKISQSEVQAYIYISKELTDKKGWTKSQIYTQGECLKHPEIKKYLLQTKPENIVEINEKIYYVIESKNERRKIDIALKEAREDYADKINQGNKIKVLFITGIAGNDVEGYISKSQFYQDGKWEDITENGIEITGLLSKKQVEDILEQKTAHLKDVEITEDEFLETAENINEILHENSINKDYRAKFISALLLAMSDGKEIDVTSDCDVLIDNINSRVKAILKKHDKLNFSNFIKIDEPSSSDNHIKVKDAIKKTYQELLNLNIRSAMNSGKDVLGKFYEVFLKYGNGAKDIGIVLTPRHITKFASEVLDINHKDLVLDVACGTGGFLVSAFDEVRRKTKKFEDFENFRINGMYGIEEQDSIISLAIVNMIFRGDGKNNMIEGNCFKKWLNAKTTSKSYCAEYLSEDNSKRIPPITKVMMNPPFALKKGDEQEYKFIEHALKQMEDGGLLFAVLPISVLVESSTNKWRKEVLLRNNTLIAVVTFPEDLFYPVGVHTLGMFIKKGIPHDYEKQEVYFVKAKNDGYVKIKGVRKESKKVRNMLEEVKEELYNFIINNEQPNNKHILEFKEVVKLNKKEKYIELVPEAYLQTDYSKFKEEDFVNAIHNYVGFLFSTYNIKQINPQQNTKSNLNLHSKKWKYFLYDKIFSVNKRGKRLIEDNREKGELLYFSASEFNNGWTDKIANPLFIEKDAIIYTTFGDAYYVQGEFTASDEITIFKDDKLNVFNGLFLSAVMSKNKYKYSFGRKAFKNKWSKDLIPLPVDKNDNPDWQFMEDYIKSLPYSSNL